MCESLHVAVKMYINYSFLHLYKVYADMYRLLQRNATQSAVMRLRAVCRSV